jgi:hypothetical protein
MKPLRCHLAVGALLCALTAFALQPVVPIQNMKGAPFQATLVQIDNRTGHHITKAGTVARSSNGSTYWEMADETGAIALIMIQDTPGRRSISLDVKNKFYSIAPFDPPSPFPDPPSPGVAQKMIAQCDGKRTSHTSGDGYDSTSVSLGVRTQGGFTECGQRVVYTQIPTTSHLSAKIWESWMIPASSLTVEYIGFDDSNQPLITQKLTDIRAEEPDPSLFGIPLGYAPRPLPPRR